MIKFFKTVLLLFLIPLCSLAQDYVQVTHLGYAEDSGAGIVQIDDEGSAYVIMSSRYDINFYGKVFPRHNATDYSVIGKLSSSGKLLWSRTISATTGGDQIQNLQVDKDHNIYISGVGGGIQLDDGSILKSGIFLLKLNKDGKTQWGIISDDTSGSNLGGPIAITDDGVFWSAIFHGYLHLQGKVLNTNSPNMGTADAFTARVTADGKVTALYHDPAKSSLPTILVPSGNGMATAVFTQGVFNNHRVVLDANCKVISDDPFFAYGYSFPALRSITGGYQALSGVFIQKNGSVSNGSFYDFKFDKYLNITDSTKVFPNQATARTVYDAIAYNNRGYFIRSPSITPGAGSHQDWFFTTGKNDFTILPDENPTNSYYTQDAFSRSFVKVVGDTLNMVVRYYSPYGKTFTFDKKQYTTPSNVDLSYFWVKYIYKDPDSCKKITAVLLNNGSEGSSDVRIKLKLPKSCPAQEDVVLNTQLTDPASNQNDFALPPQVTIKKGETETELVLKVADDRYIENLESFSLSFTAAANPLGYLMSPSNGPVKFTITDNDNTPFNKRCNITYSPDIPEGTSGTVTVSLPDTVLLSYPLTLTFQKDSEMYQATENTDYTPLKLTIPAGSNKVQFGIEAFKDQVIEGDEYISGSLVLSKNEISGFSSEDSLVRIKITDEDNTGDNMVITVTPSANVLSEGSGTTYQFSLISPYTLQRPLTVQLSQQAWFPFLNQSAGKLVFDSSKAQGSLVIDYPDDKIIRSDKTVKLLLASLDIHAGKFQFKLGSTLIDTLSIKATDNDREHAVITLSPVKYSMREGTSDQLELQLPADYSFEDNVNLDYTWSGMGITTDQRIVNQSGNVTFPKSQNALYFPVNVLDNKVVDRYNQRTVAFKVSRTIATPVTITPQDYSEVTIIDDDITSLHIPNTFTPNNDGINDTWNITNLAFDSHSKVTIFNRLGAVVYFSNGYAVPWNGRAGNSDIPVGTYYYIISFYNKTFSGNVTVIR